MTGGRTRDARGSEKKKVESNKLKEKNKKQEADWLDEQD